jgi:hypothetical protein
MSETHHYHKYHDGVPVTSTDPLRARLEKLFSEILEAVDEHAAKPEPELTDDQIIAELEKLSRINSDKDEPTSAFYKLAAKRFKLALAEREQLEEAILDWHVLTNGGRVRQTCSQVEAWDRLREIGDNIIKSREGGNQ